MRILGDRFNLTKYYIFTVSGGEDMAEENIVQEAGRSLAQVIVGALKAYGWLLIGIIVLVAIVSFGEIGLELLEDALQIAVNLIP